MTLKCERGSSRPGLRCGFVGSGSGPLQPKPSKGHMTFGPVLSRLSLSTEMETHFKGYYFFLHIVLYFSEGSF